VQVVPTDPTDDMLFAAALEGRATYVVSGDLADVRPVKLWKPYEVAIQVVSAPYFATGVLQPQPGGR
jgi:predicted nucleic acid-binding protein